MSDFIVHGIPGSPYVRAALLALEEKGADYTLAAMKFGTLKQEPHLARHPFGRIPAFEHNGWMLYETQAILRYVDAVIPGPSLQPAEPRAAARMAQLLGVTVGSVMPQVSATISFNRLVAPRFGMPVNEARISEAVPNARICMGEIGRLMDSHPWLAGETLSLADLLLAPHLSMFALTGEGKVILEDHPRLTEWLTRMEARPSMRATTWDALTARWPVAA
ncbi:MAG TPA: glutathione S-transferase family protein [Stellaceae bacterium]|nr:glutathione S-transferase family protein [Stellaceae bacterium]